MQIMNINLNFSFNPYDEEKKIKISSFNSSIQTCINIDKQFANTSFYVIFVNFYHIYNINIDI